MDRMEIGKMLWESLERAWPEYETWADIGDSDRALYAEVAEDFLGRVEPNPSSIGRR